MHEPTPRLHCMGIARILTHRNNNLGAQIAFVFLTNKNPGLTGGQQLWVFHAVE
jgi:hypothetical protein